MDRRSFLRGLICTPTMAAHLRLLSTTSLSGGPWTLMDYARQHGDARVNAVIDRLSVSSPLLAALPFRTVEGETYRYVRPETPLPPLHFAAIPTT